MKNQIYFYFLGAVFLFASCANVDKMVDRGNYDQALELATRKLAGKKNKKVKYVAAVEEAFRKVTERDMARIRHLKSKNTIADWEKILHISNDIIYRQEIINPFLPLIDKSGYKATFSFVQADKIRHEAIAHLSNEYLNLGMNYLTEGRANDIHAARKAFDYFGRVLDFKPQDTRLINLRREAEQLGIVHVLVDIESKSGHFIPGYLKSELEQFNQIGRRSQWVQFHDTNLNEDFIPHYISKINITDIEISPEQVREVVHHFTRQIDETRYLRDERGRVIRDSTGNKIEIIVPIEVRGRVFEFDQFKEARVHMTVEIYDAQNRTLLRKERMQASGLFDNVGCRIDGDRRAIDGRWLEMGEPLPFPTDESLLLTAADELKIEIERYILNFPFEQT